MRGISFLPAASGHTSGLQTPPTSTLRRLWTHIGVTNPSHKHPSDTHRGYKPLPQAPFAPQLKKTRTNEQLLQACFMSCFMPKQPDVKLLWTQFIRQASFHVASQVQC